MWNYLQVRFQYALKVLTFHLKDRKVKGSYLHDKGDQGVERAHCLQIISYVYIDALCKSLYYHEKRHLFIHDVYTLVAMVTEHAFQISPVQVIVSSISHFQPISSRFVLEFSFSIFCLSFSLTSCGISLLSLAFQL